MEIELVYITLRFITGGKLRYVLYPSVPHALTIPLARLPGIARNDRRATVFVAEVASKTCILKI